MLLCILPSFMLLIGNYYTDMRAAAKHRPFLVSALQCIVRMQKLYCRRAMVPSRMPTAFVKLSLYTVPACRSRDCYMQAILV